MSRFCSESQINVKIEFNGHQSLRKETCIIFYKIFSSLSAPMQQFWNDVLINVKIEFNNPQNLRSDTHIWWFFACSFLCSLPLQVPQFWIGINVKMQTAKKWYPHCLFHEIISSILALNAAIWKDVVINIEIEFSDPPKLKKGYIVILVILISVSPRLPRCLNFKMRVKLTSKANSAPCPTQQKSYLGNYLYPCCI